MRTAGLLLVLLVSTFAFAGEPPTPKSQPSPAQQQEAPAKAAPAAALPPPTPAPATGTHAQERRDSPWRFGVMELLTALTCGVLIFQSILMRRSTSLAAKAAEAAKQSADTLPMLERAYVFVIVDLEYELLPSNTRSSSSIRVTARNMGKTPAVLTLFRGYAELCQTIPTELITHARSDARLPQGLVIADEPWQQTIEVRINDDDMRDIKSLARTLYVVGRIDYQDVLRKDRQTGFCWMYQPSPFPRFIMAPDTALNFTT